MNIQTVFAVLAIIAAYAWIKHRQRQAEQAEQEQAAFDSARLQGEISALYRASQELEQLDEMIIDLRLCKPDELHKAFRIEWQGSTKAHSLDFMSTGANTNTAHMIALAEDQREQVNADIQARIADLYARAQERRFFDAYHAQKLERSYQNGEQYDLEPEPAGE